MNEQLKDRLFIFCIIITVFSLILAVTAGVSAQRNRTKFQKEMALRLDTEERLENSKFVVSTLEGDIKKLQNQASSQKDSCADLDKALEEAMLMNKALKEELIRTNRLKEALESSLKDALAGTPPGDE